MTKACSVCGAEFTPTGRGSASAVACPGPCREQHQRRRVNAKRQRYAQSHRDVLTAQKRRKRARRRDAMNDQLLDAGELFAEMFDEL